MAHPPDTTAPPTGVPLPLGLMLLGSLGLLAFCTLAYALRPDSLAAFTVVPVWAWALVGLLPLASTLWSLPRRTLLVALAWLVYLFALADEPRSLIRGLVPAKAAVRQARREGQALRVISFNAKGERQALWELARFTPDIVLLQEAPHDTDQMITTVCGPQAQIVQVGEVAVIAPGEVTYVTGGHPEFAMMHAKVVLPSGREVRALSVHLPRAIKKVDLWNPDTWDKQAYDRWRRRGFTADVAKMIDFVMPETPILLGGDFNMPQGDAAFRVFRPRLRDTFLEAGRGWGNTNRHPYPLLRIDQIWASNHFRALDVHTEHSRYSDHDMVVADLRWDRPKR
jgi:endonuclease/exonuclease/phosphatase (EEP) superfamily protein YafD